MRKHFSISLMKTKNVMCWIEDDSDIVEAQARLFGDLTSLDINDCKNAGAEQKPLGDKF